MLDILKKAFLEGYASGNFDIGTVMLCLILTSLLAIYIYYVYRQINRNAFYNRNFNLSLIIIAIIVSAIILTIQSNIVVSLGMVGALSIVRYRTAIKDPMDLAFLFWSISVGIICGAGYAMIAIIGSIIITVVLVVYAMLPEGETTKILVVNATNLMIEDQIIHEVHKYSKICKVRSKSATKDSLNMAIEVEVEKNSRLLNKVLELKGVSYASLVEHNGDITA